MKVIDLVEQITLKNIPKRIKYNDYEWEYDGENYKIQASSGTYMNWDYIIFNCLNDEVEIIEEPQEHKIPKKIEICYSPDIEEEIFYEKGNKPNHYVLGDAGNKLIISKINEILDYLEEKE